jgi:hypothetical protein
MRGGGARGAVVPQLHWEEHAMTLSVNDTILDEEFRPTQTGTDDDNDIAALSAGVQAAIDAVSDATDFYSSPTGFPQFAENTDFYSSGAVTDLFLAYNGSGDPWPAAGVATGLLVGTDEVYLVASGDDNVVFGRLGGATGEIVLVIAIEETKDTDGFVTAASLWMGMYAPLVQDGQDLVDSADQLDLTDLIYLGSDFDTTEEVPFENFAGVKSGQDAFAPVADTDPNSTTDVQLIVTGFAGSTVGTVNVSTQGLGTNAQHVDKGESLRVDFVTGQDTTHALEAAFVHDAANIDYDNHVNAISASFEIEQQNPTNTSPTVSVFAFQDEDTDGAGTDSADYQGALFPTKAITDPGTAVQIDPEDVIILNALDQDITNTDFDGTITADGMGVKITGLQAGWQVKFTTDNVAFDRFVVTNTSTIKGPSTFDIGEIHVTVIEGGSDTEFAELGSHLIYQDDGPVIELSGDAAPGLLVDESDFTGDDSDDFSGLFDPPDYGADGEGSLVYTLEINGGDGTDSTVVETASNHSVFLFLDAVTGDIVGREGTDSTDAETGDEVFRISVDSDGNVTLDQSTAIVHGDPDDPDETSNPIPAGLIKLTATVTDGEADGSNDSSSTSADIGDAFAFKDDGPDIDGDSGENLLVTNGETPKDSDSGDFDLNAENDAQANVTIIAAPDSNGFTFSFDDSDHDSITGSYNGNELYTLSVDDDGGYLFTLTGELAPTEDHLDTTDIKAGGPDTNFIDVGTTLTDDFCRLSGFDSNGNPVPINESNANVGVKNGNLDNGESIKFELFAPDGADAGNDPDQTYFLGLNIGTKSAKASDYTVTVDFLDPSVTDITFSQHVGKNGTLVINPAGDDLIQSITVEKDTGPALKLGLGDIDILRPPGDFGLTFNLQLTDGDMDHDEASFLVQIDGDADGLITDPVLA